jgi:hypothetical protein
MKILTCTECDRPNGVVLTDPADTDESAAAALDDHLAAEWAAIWNTDREPGWPATPPPRPQLPDLDTVNVIYVSQAAADWLYDLLYAGAVEVAANCWQPIDDICAPDWWIASRRLRARRALLVKTCCYMPNDPAGLYEKAAA